MDFLKVDTGKKYGDILERSTSRGSNRAGSRGRESSKQRDRDQEEQKEEAKEKNLKEEAKSKNLKEKRKLKRTVASQYISILEEKIDDPLFLLFKKKDINNQSHSPFVTTFVQLKSIL